MILTDDSQQKGATNTTGKWNSSATAEAGTGIVESKIQAQDPSIRAKHNSQAQDPSTRAKHKSQAKEPITRTMVQDHCNVNSI